MDKSFEDIRNIKPTYIYTPVIAAAHTPPYKIHKYFARRPYNVFEELVQNFTNNEEIILDPFCGGGVTIYEGIVKNRKVIGCDINPLSIFIVQNMIKRTRIEGELSDLFIDIEKYIEYLESDFIKFNYNGNNYKTEWSEFALSVRCPSCGKPTPLANYNKVKVGKYLCENKDCINNDNEGFDVNVAERCDPIALFLVSNDKNNSIHKKVDSDDINRYHKHIQFLKKELSEHKISVPQDIIPLDWDRQFEDGLSKKGILYFQDFFTKRNLYILLLVLNKIKSYNNQVDLEKYELLRLVFSNTIKDTNIMSFTNKGWQSGKPTTWSKHAYWVPNQFCEVNILSAFKKSKNRIINALKYNHSRDYDAKSAKNYQEFSKDDFQVLLFNKPLNFTDIPENSIDAIITDPPYGSNVQYLELSHFWYPWNKDLYDIYPKFELEAIANRKKGFKGAKDQYDYENNLYPVFEKSYKCLKINKYMTLTFNNKDISSWLGLLFSIFKSGFVFNNMYFQDGVKNYKQTAHTKAEGSPYGDFIYVFRKPLKENKIKYKYDSEQIFTHDLDVLFKKYLDKEHDKNQIILDMFLEAIPLIEGFAKSYLKKNGSHSLYKHFNKTYMNKLYTAK